MQKLNVIYCGWGERWLLGTLALSNKDAKVLFEYSQAAISKGLELSPLHFPIPKHGSSEASPTFTSAHCPSFIDDALPDGWGMLLMDRALRKAGVRIETVTILDRLAIVGSAAMGALAFEPETTLDEHLATAQFALHEIAAQVAAVQADSNELMPLAQLQTLMRLGGSPQGARPKALLDKAGVPWLYKFPASDEHPEVCAIEELYARLARFGGLEIPQSEYVELGKKSSKNLCAFGVKRFDRVMNPWQNLPVSMLPATLLRVPMLSAAALLEANFRLPSLDYETLLLATARITADAQETYKMFERCVVNVLLHNRDDHAKNFAFCLNQSGEWKVSPVFDLTFSQGPGGEHSTSIAGEGANPQRNDLLKVAAKGGISAKKANACIAHWQDVISHLPSMAKELPIRRQTVQTILKIVSQKIN